MSNRLTDIALAVTEANLHPRATDELDVTGLARRHRNLHSLSFVSSLASATESGRLECFQRVVSVADQ